MIRDMTKADLAAVMEIEEDLFPIDAWSIDMFLEELAQVPHSRKVCVLELAGQIIGYASLRFIGSQGDINTISVSKNFQRRGYGQQLLDWLEQTAKEKGVKELFLDVRTDNDPALAIYRKNGYVRIDVRRNYYGHSIDADVMRKKLA